MGTINYGTNNILCTLGYNVSTNKYEDSDIKSIMRYKKCNEETAISILEDGWRETIDDLFFGVKHLFNKPFTYYQVKVKPGYYEGFYIDIEDTYSCLDSNDRIKMNKELTEIKDLMKLSIRLYDMVVCYPGWCNSYETSEQSLKDLQGYINAERNRIKNIPNPKEYWETVFKR